MKYSLFLFLLFLQLSFKGSAQNKYTGFYGKTNFVEVLSVSHSPILYNLGRVGYKKRNSHTLAPHKNWFNTGIHLNVGKAIKNKLALSFEFGVDFSKLHAVLDHYDKDYTTGDYYDASRHESLSIRYFRFIPKIEFTTFDGLLPSGLSHQLGIGYTLGKVAQKDYLVQPSDIYGTGNTKEFEFSDFTDIEKSYSGLQFLYGLKMRTPVSKSLFISYGFRYMLNVRLSSATGTPYGRSLPRAAGRQQLFNFMSVDLGLTMPF